MSKVLAVINFIDRHGRPIDPGHPDNSLPGGGDIDNTLPPVEGPVDPGFGIGLPPVIDNGLPGRPSRPDNSLPPTYPVKPDNGLPSPPTMWPKPPFPWPPPQPVYPSLPIYLPDEIDNSLPLPPGSVWPPLPPQVQGKLLAFCWIVGVGYRWVVIDPSLKPGFPDNSLPGEGGQVDNSLPPYAQPKK